MPNANINFLNPAERYSTLGSNLYALPNLPPLSQQLITEQKGNIGEPEPKREEPITPTTTAQDFIQPYSEGKIMEVNCLAKLIGVEQQVQNTFKLSLDLQSDDEREKRPPSNSNVVIISASSIQQNANLTSVMKSFSILEDDYKQHDTLTEGMNAYYCSREKTRNATQITLYNR